MQAWTIKLQDMRNAFQQVRAMDRDNGIDANLKTSAWLRFSTAFAEDNPYSSEDNMLRDQAASRIVEIGQAVLQTQQMTSLGTGTGDPLWPTGKVCADCPEPVRAAIAAALSAAEQDYFVPLLSTPFNEEERAAIIDEALDYSGKNLLKLSSLERLGEAEHIAENTRHVTVQIPGATAKYYEINDLGNPIYKGVSFEHKTLEWMFPVPFADRHQLAMNLQARIAPRFSADPKWRLNSDDL
ncbi:MAG: hypothetical protein HOJ61_16890 [Gammaproteobacteria bacterium]|nr:hypothetical protein [Gammaproteobacteria bacterium]